MRVLRIRISAPSVHFRIVHSNNPRRTYPLPPYSTVIGLLCNILGKQAIIEKLLTDELVLGIVSKYGFITKEYTWLRNIHNKAHIDRFGIKQNRKWQENQEHFGGQSPIIIEVINEIELYLYVYHPNQDVIICLMENAILPEKWLNHLHLGRSEDWVILDAITLKELIWSNKVQDFRNTTSYFQWFPKINYLFGLTEAKKRIEYSELYKKIQGNTLLISSLYKKITVPYMDREVRQNTVIRNFQQIPVKLCQSQIPFLDNLKMPELLVDEELATPVYMCSLVPDQEGGL